MKTAAFHTLGCRVNQYETEAVCELFCKAGYACVGFHERADVYVINTCTVTAESDKKSRQMARRAKKQNPDAVVLVMGCFAQIHPEEAEALAGVDLVIGTKRRAEAVKLVEQFLETKERQNLVRPLANDPFEPLEISEYGERTRAYIKIQEGCRQFCTYCVIPYARGQILSRPEDDVIAEAKRLAEAGFSEVVFTGIHIASYGSDTKTDSLLSVLQRADQIPGIRRIRLGSLEPNVMDFGFVDEIASIGKLCPHFHISLQSGCDATLLRMNRKYTAQKYWEYIEKIRSVLPDAAITTDLMVGFPGETDEEFEQSYQFVKSVGFSHIHTFMYSPRPGTPAATYPNQVPPDVKKKRSERMLSLSKESTAAFLSRYHGEVVEVLWEQQDRDGFLEGYTPNYLRVKALGDPQAQGCICRVRIVSAEQDCLVGESIE